MTSTPDPAVSSLLAGFSASLRGAPPPTQVAFRGKGPGFQAGDILFTAPPCAHVAPRPRFAPLATLDAFDPDGWNDVPGAPGLVLRFAAGRPVQVSDVRCRDSGVIRSIVEATIGEDIVALELEPGGEDEQLGTVALLDDAARAFGWAPTHTLHLPGESVAVMLIPVEGTDDDGSGPAITAEEHFYEEIARWSRVDGVWLFEGQAPPVAPRTVEPLLVVQRIEATITADVLARFTAAELEIVDVEASVRACAKAVEVALGKRFPTAITLIVHRHPKSFARAPFPTIGGIHTSLCVPAESAVTLGEDAAAEALEVVAGVVAGSGWIVQRPHRTYLVLGWGRSDVIAINLAASSPEAWLLAGLLLQNELEDLSRGAVERWAVLVQLVDDAPLRGDGGGIFTYVELPAEEQASLDAGHLPAWKQGDEVIFADERFLEPIPPPVRVRVALQNGARLARSVGGPIAVELPSSRVLVPLATAIARGFAVLVA